MWELILHSGNGFALMVLIVKNVLFNEFQHVGHSFSIILVIQRTSCYLHRRKSHPISRWKACDTFCVQTNKAYWLFRAVDETRFISDYLPFSMSGK